MKTLILAIVVTMMAKPVDVEALWSDAQAAFRAYRFDDAIALVDEYISNPKHNAANDRTCADLRQRADRASEMMQAVEDVTILDSVKCHKTDLLTHYGVKRDVGRLRMDQGGVTFTTGRGDRSIVAQAGESGFDLWLHYSDGERRRLSDVVNTSANENYPFELSDGVTLYFASDGHGSIGGYDLFMTRYNNESFEYSEPMQIGMPFNSTANDYMMVIDELTGVGWFATDRLQHCDTVVVYKFRVEEQKRLLPNELDDEVRIASAQMRRYRTGYDRKESVRTTAADDAACISFVVNDTLIYTSVSQFTDSASRTMYAEIQDLERGIKLRSVVMEGKKREYQVTDDPTDRATLRSEILEDEEYLEECKRRILDLTKVIRRNENK